MSISRRTVRLALPLVVTMLAAVPTCSQAQVAPQLLPYNMTSIAGGGTAAIAKGATCPVSGYTSTDAYGDGCLATEVQLSAPRFVTTDKNGVVFFSDSGNGLVRRIDPITGIITAVAGGATSSPGSGTACGSFTSTDSDGNGCLANAVKLSKPEGLAFSAAGDLYVADNGYDDIRKIAATAGVITTTGVISNVAGGTTYGYKVNNTAGGPVTAATQSYFNYPYGIAFDASGNLYVSDEGNNAIEVINLNATAQTIQGVSVPAGTIQKIVGYGSLAAKSATNGDCPSFTSTSARGGCYYGKWTDGSLGNVSNVDGNYDVAVDAAGNLYFANEFNEDVGVVTPANVLTNYAGIQGTKGTTLKRAAAGSFGIGSNFNVALDPNGNLYTSDAVSGVVWRVDAGTKSMYVIAGGASTVCSAATDAIGDGCPATQATLSIGTLNGSGYATAPGVAGISIGPFGSLFLTDATTNLVRMASSGTNFGVVGANQPTQIADIHLGVSDSLPASGATITMGASNFKLGTPTCTTNSDNTTDCLLPITATPSTLGLFTGQMTVTSTLGATATFALSGTYAQSPITRTTVSAVSTTSSCAGSTTYATTTPLTLTATVIANGPSAPSGTLTFFANGAQIGSPVKVANLGTTSSAIYGAVLTYTFSTPNTYTITAAYSGDTYFKSSTGQAPNTVTSSLPTFSATAVAYQQNTVTAGQTGLYSFTVVQNVYSGTINIACSGLPANSSCSFTPATLTATGCSATNTVAVSVLTQARSGTKTAGFGMGKSNRWTAFSILGCFAMALLLGLRRRRLKLNSVWLALMLLGIVTGLTSCSGNVSSLPGTPAGSYNVTINLTGSTGTTSSITVPLTVK